MNRRILSVFFVFVLGGACQLFAQGTAFNYQGRLSDAGAPANAAYDFRFAVYDAVTNGTQVSVSLTNAAVPVTNGLFNVTLDFGTNVFKGASRWLDIAVRAVGVTNFTALAPRQPVLPVPYAMFATTASNVLGSVSAAQLTGTASNPVNFTNNNNTFAGTFSGTFAGNGAALTDLNASQLATGTVPDARLSNNVARLDRDQTYSGANNFTNVGNRFTGSFFGNGNVGWDAVVGTSVQAEFNHGYLLTNSQLTTVTLPPTPASSDGTNIGYIVRVSGAGSGGWRVAQNTNQAIYGNFLSAISSDWQQGSGPGKGLNGIAASANGLKMVAVAGGGNIYVSSDAGKTWNNQANYLMTCVASSSDGVKLVAGNNAGSSASIVLSTNAGSTWFTSATSPANCRALASSSDGTRLVAVVNGGRIYTSANSGTNWVLNTASPNNANRNWYSVGSSSDGSKCAAVVNGGQIYTSTNFGTNWTQQAGSPSASWVAICSSSDGSRLAAAVSGGRIYTSTDFGVSWTQQTNAPSANWTAIACSADGSRLIATIAGGGIYMSVNQGVAWTKLMVADQSWTGVACSADGTKMAATYFVNSTTGGVYYGQAYFQTTTTTTTGLTGSIGGSQGTAVELQYIGNGQFMPVSSAGVIWAN